MKNIRLPFFLILGVLCPAVSGAFDAAAFAEEAGISQPAVTPSAAERISSAIGGPERTRRAVQQMLDDMNSTYLTLWTVEEPSANPDQIPTPAEIRSRRWDAFYRDPEARIDYQALSVQCIDTVYRRYFNEDEFDALAIFLSGPKTRADVAAFAKTPLGRKYRSVLRRLSTDTRSYIQNQVHQVMLAVFQDQEGKA